MNLNGMKRRDQYNVFLVKTFSKGLWTINWMEYLLNKFEVIGKLMNSFDFF